MRDTLFESIKNLCQFEERESDWWIFTLLPIGIFFPIAALLLVNHYGVTKIILAFSQQLLAYTLIQSSTDLAIRSRAKSEKKSIGFPWIYSITAALLLIGLYLSEKAVLSSWKLSALYLIISAALAYLSVRSYNHNPGGSSIGPNDFSEVKASGEKSASEIFQSAGSDTAINGVKWGE
jgi:uncharacterized membrane protein